MRVLSAPELLRIWEHGVSQPPIQRALELLSGVYPDAPERSLLGLSIGVRNAHLLALREQLFGPKMAGVTACPQCGGRLDLALNAFEMRSICASDQEIDEEKTYEHDGFEVKFRHPTSEDLAVVLGESDREGAPERLLDRCLVSIRHGGVVVTSDRLPREVSDGVSELMGETDPLADIQLAVSCMSCEHRWRVPFDIVSFLWREVENLAGRLLREVHALASAYGWRENDILALSPVRREFYLAALGA
jgi:hypothetical protein